MHIVQIIDDLKTGGAQQTVVNLARDIDYTTHKLTVISLNGNAPLQQEIEASGASVTVLDSSGLISPPFLLKLHKRLKSIQPTVVQTHLLYSNVIGGIATRFTGIPCCATLHARDDHPRYARSLKRLIETLILRTCHNKWIAVANSVAHSHQRRLPGPRMRVLENAVSCKDQSSFTTQQRKNIREQTFNVSSLEDSAVWICVSRLVKIKGIEDLLDAFTLALRVRPQDKLIIVGSGPEEDSIKAHIESLNLTEHVRLLGQRRDVASLLLSADLFVSAAHSEGLPLSLLEAMAASLPVVHTDVGEVSQVVDQECAIIVPVKNPQLFASAALDTLNSNRIQAMRNRAREIVQTRFGTTTWIEKLLTELSEPALTDDSS